MRGTFESRRISMSRRAWIGNELAEGVGLSWDYHGYRYAGFTLRQCNV
jgi:hypothetical protein